MRKQRTFNVSSIPAFFADFLTLRYFAEGALDAVYTPGESKLLLITGENATGKSFGRRLLAAALNQAEGGKIEFIQTSMQWRTGAGICSFQKAVMFGDESQSSTGSLSGHGATMVVKTSRGRSGRHAVFADEPELGMSDSFAIGSAQSFRGLIEDAPEQLFFLAVASHRKCMMRALASAKPHHLHFIEEGGRAKSLTEWLDEVPVGRSLEALEEENRNRSRKIQAIQNALQRERREATI